MFGRKKQLKKIEDEKQRLLLLKEQLSHIKEYLDDNSPRVDISNVCVLFKDDVYYIVKRYDENITGMCASVGRNIQGYKTTFIDIFSNNIVYEWKNQRKMNQTALVGVGEFGCTHVCEVRIFSLENCERGVLAFPDKKVPLYVLEQIYYNINGVNLSAPILRKKKQEKA